MVGVRRSPSIALQLASHEQESSQFMSTRVSFVQDSAAGVALVLGAREQSRAVVQNILYCVWSTGMRQNRGAEGLFQAEKNIGRDAGISLMSREPKSLCLHLLLTCFLGCFFSQKNLLRSIF